MEFIGARITLETTGLGPRSAFLNEGAKDERISFRGVRGRGPPEKFWKCVRNYAMSCFRENFLA